MLPPFCNTHEWNTHLCTPLDCAVHHLACPVQLKGYTGMGQVFTFAHVVLDYRAIENVTPV